MRAGSRRQARERALSLLYEAEVKEAAPLSLLEQLPAPPDPFVVELLAGVQRDGARIDELISRFSVDWPLGRMPVVDRNLLRIAVFELLERPDVPVAAVISEAVELAKSYSTEQSGRFVNGVLGSIAAELRGGSAA